MLEQDNPGRQAQGLYWSERTLQSGGKIELVGKDVGWDEQDL